MDKQTSKPAAAAAAAALPTSFVAADEAAALTKMLELEFEQAEQVAGGLAAVARCCACHCCGCH